MTADCGLRGRALGRAALAVIRADPASWNQLHWSVRTPCGTAYCFAGHVARLMGEELTEGWNVCASGRSVVEVALCGLLGPEASAGLRRGVLAMFDPACSLEYLTEKVELLPDLPGGPQPE